METVCRQASNNNTDAAQGVFASVFILLLLSGCFGCCVFLLCSDGTSLNLTTAVSSAEATPV